MKLEQIFVSNFLGVTAIDVSSAAPVQLFAGRNGAGKSSVRDAIALALTADLGRVTLKKDAGQLVHDGADAAVCEVKTVDGDVYSVTINRAGKITDSQKGRTDDPALRYVLDAQRFARLEASERRAFLFGLMGLTTDGPAIVERLEKRRADMKKVERIAPLLRAGFDAASKEAKSKATEAKGAWRAITGETFGSEKAKTWRAPEPVFDAAGAKTAATELQHADVAIGSWQQQVGKLQAEQQRRAALRAKLPALNEQAMRLERIERKLAADEATLADVAEQLAKAAAAAGGAPRVGVVHRLAAAVARALPAWPNQDQVEAGWTELREALTAYEQEHGPVVLSAAGNPQARARLPQLQHAHDTAASAVAHDKRDLEAVRRAQAEIAAIEAELQTEFDADALAAAQEQIEKLKAQRANLAKRCDAIRAAKAAADAAEKKTADAAAHAADVAAWDSIGDALGPDGIPAELLAEALGPINERLAQSAADADWPSVAIDADMAITAGGRPYRLLSESEQWRADAMLAEAIAHLSGVRLLVLDRFDVLDLTARSLALGWLDVLADTGEIDTALVFGTLKALPTGLPTTIAAHWIENGVVGQLKEAA